MQDDHSIPYTPLSKESQRGLVFALAGRTAPGGSAPEGAAFAVTVLEVIELDLDAPQYNQSKLAETARRVLESVQIDGKARRKMVVCIFTTQLSHSLDEDYRTLEGIYPNSVGVLCDPDEDELLRRKEQFPAILALRNKFHQEPLSRTGVTDPEAGRLAGFFWVNEIDPDPTRRR